MVYTEDLSQWEDWQRDYRFGVILILPPPEFATAIDILRQQHDPKSHAISPAHISVTDPLDKAMTPAHADEIRRLLSDVSPFDIELGEIEASTEHAGVYFPIHPREPIDALKQVLHGASVFSDAAHERRDIPPHMTIAEFLSIEESLELRDSLAGLVPRGWFTCTELAYLVPDASFRFEVANTFQIGGNQPGN